MNNDQIDQTPETFYQELFNHMSQEHGLTLINSELQDIEQICNRQLEAKLAIAVEALEWIRSNNWIDGAMVPSVEANEPHGKSAEALKKIKEME